MEEYKDVQIKVFNVDGGTVTILRGGLNKPKSYMDNVVSQYVGRTLHNEFVEIFLDNPYVRIIVTGINEFHYETFNPLIHHLKDNL